MRKVSLSLLALALVFALSGAAIFAQTAEGDVFGYFFINGKAAKGFTDIDHLNLGGEGEYGAQAKPPYYGQIRLKNQTDFKLLKPSRDGKSISFKTKAIGGVSYEFMGVLSRTDFVQEPQPTAEEKVLSGTLKKMKAGKMIASTKVSFRWELGD